MNATQARELRSRIVQDDDPTMPYDDGGSPLLSYDHNGYAQQVTETTSYVVHPRIVEALNRWTHEPEMFERYVRAFHGATRVEWYSPGHYQGELSYVTLDPAEWRETVGSPAGSISLDEWRAYIEGDVYGVVIEERVVWTTESAYDDREEWETLASVWGFYGLPYAEEYAAEMLESYRD